MNRTPSSLSPCLGGWVVEGHRLAPGPSLRPLCRPTPTEPSARRGGAETPDRPPPVWSEWTGLGAGGGTLGHRYRRPAGTGVLVVRTPVQGVEEVFVVILVH